MLFAARIETRRDYFSFFTRTDEFQLPEITLLNTEIGNKTRIGAVFFAEL